MKKIVLLLAAMLTGVVSCKQAETTNSESKQTSNTVIAPSNNQVSVPASLTNLFAPNSNVFRGTDFTFTPSRVKQTEQAELLKESSGALKYSIDLGGQNFADFEYVFIGGSLSKIQADVYTQSQSDSKKLYADLTAFFDKKYKKRKLLWEGSEKQTTFTIFAKPDTKSAGGGMYIVWEKI